MDDDYGFELSVSRENAAGILRGLGDGVAAGSVRLGEDGLVADVPAWLDVEVEYESDDAVELEVELTWYNDTGANATPASDSPGMDTTDRTDDTDAPSVGGEHPRRDEPVGTDSTSTPRDESSAESPAVGENPARLVGAGEVDAGEPDAERDADDADDTDHAGDAASEARFELFEDGAGEWRWRLVHRNGNVVATSGEGYTRKHNAEKGLRSVMRTAPGATVVTESDD